jgi:hypothetical protein
MRTALLIGALAVAAALHAQTTSAIFADPPAGFRKAQSMTWQQGGPEGFPFQPRLL